MDLNKKLLTIPFFLAALAVTGCDTPSAVSTPLTPESASTDAVEGDDGFVDETGESSAVDDVQPTSPAVEPTAKPPLATPVITPVPTQRPASVQPVAAAPTNSPEQSDTMTARCADCGRIESINQREVKGEGSGLGAAAGAVLGGIVGHQFGSGKGKKAATAIGALGGAIAGHEVEKRKKASALYDVVVRMDSGSYETVTTDDAYGFMVGDRVRVIGDSLQGL